MELGIIMVGRFLGTFVLVSIVRCICYDPQLSLREIIFIWYAGMIRGAIAFGLVLRIDNKYENKKVIVTTALLLVIFTTVVFGSTVGILGTRLFPEDSSGEIEDKG